MNETNSSVSSSEVLLPSVAYWSLKAIISIVAVLGNGVVMWLICTRRRLHCTANWYVLSLASADFCTGLIITPSELICLWKPAMCIWPLVVRGSFYNYPVNVSICCLCVLTFDRYLCVLSPLQYTRRMTSKLVVGLISLSWILPGILTFVSLFWLKAPTNIQDTANKVLTLIQIFLVSFLPSIFLVYAYTRILFAAMKQWRRSAEHISQLRFNHVEDECERVKSQGGRERSSTVKILGFVITFFVLCWIPSVYRAICGAFLPCTVSAPIVQISRLLILLNSGMNFAVYAFLKQDIRKELCKTCRKTRGRSRESFHLMERSSRASSNQL
ncbi:trace amine-associated receptor 7d-like [Oculina patagonica]